MKQSKIIEAAKPLIDYLRQNYDPMAIAVVSDGRVDVFRAEEGALTEEHGQPCVAAHVENHTLL